MPGKPAGQRGVALITAMLVVSMVTIAAVAMASRLQLDVRRSGNLIHGDQALLYARGVEAWAGQVLRRDAEDSEADHLGEDWATVLPPISVEGGQITGQMEDMQGRFNLNNLVDAEGKPSPVDFRRFQRLLAALELSPDLADAVVDWLDPDVDARFPGGAEDSEYMSLEEGYRAANRPMGHPSELRLVAGFDREAYGELKPYVTALPQRTAINLNTAAPPVLQTLADEVGPAAAEALVEAREGEGFESVNDALKHEALAGIEIESEGLDVASGWFLVRSTIAVGRLQVGFYGLLARRGDGSGRPVARGYGDY